MRLIGMLDSPYVRRVAISLRLMGFAFEHEPLSVFSTYDAFAAIHPVVKAPTLVLDDGLTLIDSGLILEHIGRLAPAELRLTPTDIAAHGRAQRIIGLAMAACEKAVQIVYERNLRPPEKQHAPWLDRVGGQLAAAVRLLEAEVATADPWLFGPRPLQADITVAVATEFVRRRAEGAFDPATHVALAALSARAEATEAFRAYPFPA